VPNHILRDLLEAGICTEDSLELYHTGTRDDNSLPVYRDKLSGAILILDFDPADNLYKEASFLKDISLETVMNSGLYDLGLSVDCHRRSSLYKHLYINKNVADFGCGTGLFLKEVSQYCRSTLGIELAEKLRTDLCQSGITAVDSLDRVPENELDTLFFFHSFEHVGSPLATLQSAFRKLRNGGSILLEVPHANDFLMHQLSCDAFRDFTLWTQHLILHTRNSLSAMVKYAGFTNVSIKGLQRYPLSNHLHWLRSRTPGGHQLDLSIIQTPELTSAYAAALASIDATDTLVCIAQK
jgi:SAM-dependent methyltransferase